MRKRRVLLLGRERRHNSRVSMAKLIFLHVALLALSIVSSAQNGPADKPIIFQAHLTTNYIFHLLTVATPGAVADRYRKSYGGSVARGDVDYLVAHRQYINYGQGAIGPLTPVFVFLPCYLGLKSEAEFREYFEIVTAGLERGDFSQFLERYGQINWADPLLAIYKARVFPTAADLNVHPDLPDTARHLAAIWTRNFVAYTAKVWPKVQPVLQQRAKRLTALARERQLIARWERLLGESFQASRYEILLYSANNGLNANSLSYDKNTFYFDDPDDEHMLQFVSHEVGTHILLPVMNRVAGSGRYKFQDVYNAYEILAMFYNQRIIAAPLRYHMENYGETRLLAAYARQYRDGASPEELLLAVLPEPGKTTPPR